MLKKFFFFLLIASPLVLSAQTMETHGFIPNKGQYGSDIEGKTLLGKFAGLSLDLWLTEEGIEIVYWLGKGDWEKEEQIGKQKIKIQGAHQITTSMLSVNDSSTEVFHYYLAHCPEGIRDVHSYGKLHIKNILNGIDWEISTDAKNAFIQTFTPSNPSLASSKIIEILSENNGTIRKDTLHMGTSYPLIQAGTFRISHQKSTPTNSAQADWGTLFGGGKSTYRINTTYDSYWRLNYNLNHSYFALTTSCNDQEGNLYAVGKTKLSTFRYNQYKDRLFIQDSAGICSDAFIAQFDTNEQLRWIIYYGSTQHDQANAVQVNPKGYIYVGGGIDLSWLRYSNYHEQYPFIAWKNDFPCYNTSGTLANSDTGACFFLKFDTEGHRLWAGLFGTETEVKNKDEGKDIKTWPTQMCFDTQSNLYVCGYHVSRSYTKDSMQMSSWGKNIPTFGQDGADVWNYDSIHLHQNVGIQNWGIPFLLKIDSTDHIIWSTYYLSDRLIKNIQVDKKGNLYIYGSTQSKNFPPTLFMEGAYFAQRTHILNLKDNDPIWAYLAAFNAQGKQIWCTHLGGDEVEDKDPYGYRGNIYPEDMALSAQGHILLTGSTTSLTFPMVKKENAISMQATKDSPVENTFIMEFDEARKLIWSTLYLHDTASKGVSIAPLPKTPGFYLLETYLNRGESNQSLEISDKLQTCYRSFFDKNFQIQQRKKLGLLSIPYVGLGIEFVKFESFVWLGLENLYNFVSPFLKLSLSPEGKLFVTGNAAEFDSLALRKPFSNSYLQTQPLWDTLPLTSFILRYDLCDTTPYVPISLGFTDSLYCTDEKINIFLQLSSADYSQHQIVWNTGTHSEVVSDTFRITQVGSYFVQARNIYSGCPSVYSDTIRVDYMQKPRHSLPTDTLSFC
ncbi:MAG: hypothetical protein RR393_08490, partial [Bacteroidales bacterium]